MYYELFKSALSSGQRNTEIHCIELIGPNHRTRAAVYRPSATLKDMKIIHVVRRKDVYNYNQKLKVRSWRRSRIYFLILEVLIFARPASSLRNLKT